MTETPLVVGHAYGLRTWRLTAEGGVEALTGPHRQAGWPEGGRWLKATCTSASHGVPAQACGCGIHAWHPGPTSARRVLDSRRLVPGIVEARGALELHYDGFRAQEARPFVLFATPAGNHRLLARLAERYSARVVSVKGPDDVLAYCREHGLGFDEAVVTDLLGPSEIRREIAARDRFKRIVALRVTAALLITAVFCAIGLGLSSAQPSGKVLNGRAGQIRTP